jgi:hypothetical protein
MNSFYLIFRKQIVKKYVSFPLVIIPLVFHSELSIASNKYSIANGNWTGSIWSHTPGGPSCGCSPAGSDSTFISHNVTLNKNLTGGSGIAAYLSIAGGASLNGGSTYDLDVKSTGTMIVSGTLIVNNLTFFNGSNVTVNPSAHVTVNGTLENKNNSNSIFFNGPVTVLGPFINGNGSAISGTGPITVTTGPITNSGTLFGCSGNSSGTLPITLPGPCASPLPVELISFTAEASKQNEVMLSWATASEVNNSFFTIEKSPDSKRFSKIADVPAAGNTSVKSNYNFIDKSADKKEVYYRLSQTDFNGNLQLLTIISVQNKDDECIRISNGSDNGVIKIYFNCSRNSTAIVSINDFVGKCISKRIISPDNSPGFIYSFSLLNSGTYIVTVVSDNAIIKKQVWKF